MWQICHQIRSAALPIAYEQQSAPLGSDKLYDVEAVLPSRLNSPEAPVARSVGASSVALGVGAFFAGTLPSSRRFVTADPPPIGSAR